MTRVWAELTKGEQLAIEELASGVNNSIFYKDASGQVQPLALGADGTVLTSNGSTAAPTFEVGTGGGGTSYTDAEIKVKYENNPDTNAFTDAEKTKVGNTSGTNTGDNAPNTNAGLMHTAGNEDVYGVKSFEDNIFVQTPTNNGHAVDKQYVDQQVAGAGGTTFDDDTFAIQDEADQTKELAFSVGGNTTGTKRTITAPDFDYDFNDNFDSTGKISLYKDASVFGKSSGVHLGIGGDTFGTKVYEHSANVMGLYADNGFNFGMGPSRFLNITNRTGTVAFGIGYDNNLNGVFAAADHRGYEFRSRVDGAPLGVGQTFTNDASITTGSKLASFLDGGDERVFINDGDTSLGVKGLGTTSATNALLVEDSIGTELLKVQDDGDVEFKNNVTLSNPASNRLDIKLGGTTWHRLDSSIAWKLNTTTQLSWGVGRGDTTQDVGIVRDSTGVLRVTNASSGEGDLITKSLTRTGALTKKRQATATDTTSGEYEIIGVTDTSAPRTITLQTVDLVDGRVYTIKDESGGAATNNITITTEGGETIDGAASITITANYGVGKVYSDGTNWFTL